MANDAARIERVASIIYADSFGAHNGGVDWDRTVERALADRSTFAAIIVSRTISTARSIIYALDEM